MVGTGIAGMSAAWLLSRRHTVTVFERDERVGGHANTVDVAGPAGPVAVDTGFIVYNERNYPNLTALFDHLGVATKASDMSFAASIDDGDLEYAGTSLAGLFAQPRNIVRPRFWRMLGDIRRFYRDGPSLLREPGGETLSLGQYLDGGGYSHAFVYNHLLPMAAAIWSTAVADMRDHPAAAFIRFCSNHGLMQVSGRPQWRTVDGGSREYVRPLTAPYADRIRLGAKIRTIRRDPRGVTIDHESGRTERFDHVVIATHADQALRLLDDPSAQERRLLGSFGYTRNVAVLHSDPALMPKRRRVWSSWNYLSRRGEDGSSRVAVSYWMNRLQRLDDRLPLFVTLNPHRDPADRSVVKAFAYDHPSYDLAAADAQRSLWTLQGVRNTWFCGSYFGAGFHEDALQAGLAVAEQLGGTRRPWRVAGESDRIAVGPSPIVEAAA
ncbi:MAG: NAD(P)/FAD-dependent oxidoreductase [Rhodospirillales bacterium]